MSPIHISDRTTDELVRRLAARRSLTLTEAINVAVSNELLKEEDEATPNSRQEVHVDADRGSLLHDLEAELRATTLDYSRLLAKRRGTKSLGSRVYQMIARHGIVETIRRLVDRPTEGLEFLKSIDRMDLSTEVIALNPRYESILSEDIRDRARANLDKVGDGS